MASKSKIATLIEQVFRDSGRGDEKLNIKRAVDDADFVSHIDPLEERVRSVPTVSDSSSSCAVGTSTPT